MPSGRIKYPGLFRRVGESGAIEDTLSRFYIDGDCTVILNKSSKHRSNVSIGAMNGAARVA